LEATGRAWDAAVGQHGSNESAPRDPNAYADLPMTNQGDPNMPNQAIRHTILALALALAAFPAFVAAQSYGDKPQQPATTGAQSQAAPAAPMNNGMMNKGSPATTSTAYQKALAACDQKSADQQQPCRDAVDARFGGNCAGLSGSAKSDCLKNIMPSIGASSTGGMVSPRSAMH
jgi:hypothetical protein